MKILILEDDNQRINKFKNVLSGYDIIHTDDAIKAIKYLKKYEFDYIFLDHDLGGKQMEWDEENCGMVVAKYLNKHPQKNATVIVHSLNIPRATEMIKLIGGSKHIPFVWDKIKRN